MALTKEYERKLKSIIDTLPKRESHCINEIEFSGFVTKDRLTLEEAEKQKKTVYKAGDSWGKRWEYGWFFADITIPSACEGKRVEFKASLGECVIFVNGRVCGALDKEHHEITLSKKAHAGDTYKIAMEVYAGHTGIIDGFELTTTSVPLTKVMIPEEPVNAPNEQIEQKKVHNGSINVFNDEVFQLWIDFNTLYQLRNHNTVTPWRRANIDKCLKAGCDALNLEANMPVFLESVRISREKLAPALACKNGDSAPTCYAIGNSHLDLEWLWTREETRRKAARTLGNQIRLIEEYDDYKYIHSQPWTLEIVKNEYPELYNEVKKWVKKGRIIIEGGMWVESDVNLPSGESLIRQFITGKSFISAEFGKNSELFWLPDSFGAPASLPQIMNGCGIKYFFSAKIPWLYNGGERFPYNNLLWSGLDGTTVLTHISASYNAHATPTDVLHAYNDLNNEKETVSAKLFPFGHGDGGGGATRLHAEYIDRQKDLEGVPKVKVTSPLEFYNYLGTCELPKYSGELYFAAHRATYTSQAKTKRLNRKAEQSLREAEMWAAIFNAENANTKSLWKDLLFNQFHDILPGSAIAEVYIKTEKELADVVEQASRITDGIWNTVLTPANDYLTVCNSLSWERRCIVELPERFNAIETENGPHLETQSIGNRTYAILTLPACGMQTYHLSTDIPAPVSRTDSELYLENNLIRADFNKYGELIKITDKESGIQFLSDVSNRFRVYRNAPTLFDAWDIDSYYEKLEEQYDDNADVKVECRGELISALTVTKSIKQSVIKQRIVLRKGSRRLDFETEIDWKEPHSLLKVDFCSNIHTDSLLSEIQFGYVKRPNHKNRQHDADQFEVCQHKWSALTEANRGFAVLNDCKYGISADNGRMSLTLIKTSAAPAMNSDVCTHQFTYSVMPYTGTFFDSRVINESYELNCPVLCKAGKADSKSYFRISAQNVIAETVKPAEDGSSDIILRLYESKGAYTPCTVWLGFDAGEAWTTDMLEANRKVLEVRNNSLTLELKPFEIVTVRIKRK